METTLQGLGTVIATHPLQTALIAVVLYPSAHAVLSYVRALWLRRRMAYVAALLNS